MAMFFLLSFIFFYSTKPEDRTGSAMRQEEGKKGGERWTK
jgi:hypothetical protein